ncbi:hypothetical protein CI109_105295 [Kwoniella shandongensis]|uniref:Protein YIP n=1 Tax=Kwoniella shandongensis TaxID=1734106 RepID=A0AAJ8LK48_9TREE
MAQQGYAVVDVDDDTGDNNGGSGLEFKTFLNTDSSAQRSTTPAPPEVPFSPFNIAYYQTYFDVETNAVLKRLSMAMIPRPGFISEICPFWTLTTLILVLYTTSTLIASITQYLNSSHASSNLPLLSTAVSVVYFYGLAVPALLWGATKWLGVGDWGVAEALGIYGYAMGVYIPISLVCLIPVGILRWALVAGGAVSSGFFL